MRSKGGEEDRINSYKVMDNPPQIRTSTKLMFSLGIYSDWDQPCLPCGISLKAILIRMCLFSLETNMQPISLHLFFSKVYIGLLK